MTKDCEGEKCGNNELRFWKIGCILEYFINVRMRFLLGSSKEFFPISDVFGGL